MEAGIKYLSIFKRMCLSDYVVGVQYAYDIGFVGVIVLSEQKN